MASVRDVLASLEQIAPRRFAYDFDRIGLQVGDPASQVKSAVVALDASLGAIRFAVKTKADLLLTHHPVIWDPIESVRLDDYHGKRISELISGGVSLIAAHTNWDCARGGVNDILAERLELNSVRDFGSGNPSKTLKLVAFVPEADLQRLVDALSEAGAGDIGAYSRCAFYSPGTGTFVGCAGSRPAVGQPGNVESVSEIRLEMILPAMAKRAVEAALREVHPYESPAYDFLTVEGESIQRIGRIGENEESVTFSEFVLGVDRRLETTSLAWGDGASKVLSVAVCGGSADEEWKAAQDAGADVLVTGEVKHHVALEAAESGFCMIAAGHFATENPAAVGLAMGLKAVMPKIDWTIFEPKAGEAGRPL